MTGRRRIGLVALARATFDVPFAEEMAARAFAALDLLDADVVGGRDLLFDATAVGGAIAALRDRDLDWVVVLQVTFTDAAMTVALADAIDAPLLLWAVPEPRAGGRLRLNALCGINLAAHALAKAGKPYGYLYTAPDAGAPAELAAALDRGPVAAPVPLAVPPTAEGPAAETATRVLADLDGLAIGVVGSHPDGFETCAYDAGALAALTGVTARPLDLGAVFSAAASADASSVDEVRERAASDYAGLDMVEPEPLDRSLRVYTALKGLAEDNRLAGLAVRCWPEFFTEYGCAACGPMAMLSQDGTPCACEADVYGNVTALILQRLAEAPVFMADLVDIDMDDDTGVFWHCGLAPVSMADPDDAPRATVHSNRRQPLLGEFALKPGRITIARLSQSRGRTRMVVGGAEMLRRPKSFTGTSGVVRYDRPAGAVLDTVMTEGLEHHYGFAYGDHRAELTAVAGALGVPVVPLGGRP
ncbi:MAG: L-fucose/L-arabinose isomerase family protein [Inquilinaceae bacterium]